MPNDELHAALRELTLDASRLLAADLEAGADLPFEVLEEGRGRDPLRSGRGPRPILYRYRPRTAAFIGARWDRVRELSAHRRAAAALGPGAAAAYLRHRGRQGSDPDDALRDQVERLFEDATSFTLPEERLGGVLAELDAMLEDAPVRATVMAPMHGVRIASPRVALLDGVVLVRRSGTVCPPGALEGSARAPEHTTDAPEDASAAEANPLDVFCVLERDLVSGAPIPVDEARTQFRRLLTSLRLCGAGGTALGPLAWARAGHGAWHPVALGVSARSRPESWELRHAEEPELRDLLQILARSRHGPTVGWALARFEMGCERELETEALSDYLLGLRALLAGDAERGRAEADGERVAARLAALCAPDAERASMEERVAAAFALERRLIHGDGRETTSALDSPRALVREIEQHLRALLRDALCGYLDEDLRRAAEEALADGDPLGRVADEVGSQADRLRARSGKAAPDEDTAELEAIESAELVGAAVTPSVDWD